MRRYTLLLACFASFSPLFGQTVLNPGSDVQAAVNAAVDGSTLALNAGVYALSGTLVIHKSITITSNTSGQRPVLQVPSSTIVGIDVKADNVTLDSLRISGSSWGVYAGNPAGMTLSNITLRNLAVNATGTNNAGHGIFVANVLNAVIDSSVIEAAPISGIIVDGGSTGAAVINNTIASAGYHGIGIVKSDSVIVAGNMITNAAGGFGIILQGSRFSRVDRNTIPGGILGDIVITRHDESNTHSHSNYIGRNVAISSSFESNLPTGTGIWLNSDSNGNLVYANTTSGAPENGLTIFNSSNDWFWGNVTSNNGQGGIFVFEANETYTDGGRPNNNFVQGNYVHALPFNSGVILRESSNTTVFNNMVRNSPEGFSTANTSGNQFYLNMAHNNTQGVHVYPGTTATTYFLNRHLNPMANYVDPPSSVTFHGGPVFGGNFQAGGTVLSDSNPYNNEQLGRAASLSILLPYAGAIVPVGTRKTIEWRSTACAYVDISYKNGSAAQQHIVANYPDVGVYQWTVPATAAGSNYTIVLDCKNSSGDLLGASASSAAFTIAPAGLELLSPQGNHRVTSGAAAKVTWRRAQGATGPVNVLYRVAPGASPVTVASNITGNDATVTIPAGGAAQASITVQMAATPSQADSTDGFVNVTSDTPAVSGPTGTVGMGTLQLVQWHSQTNSYYVDIEYWDTSASTFRTLVTNLPDFGRFYFLVPDKAMTGTRLRVRSKTSALEAMTTAESGIFNTAISGTPGGGTTSPATPDAVGISPGSGAGTTQTFTATYTDANGATDIAVVYFMVNTAPNGVNSCFLEYNRVSNSFRLMNNAGNTWSSPIPAGSGSASNSSCSFSGSGAGATVSGNSLAVSFPLTFPQTTPGTRNTYGLAIDAGGANSNWKTLGSWTIPASTAPSVPDVVSLTPTSGSGTSRTFTAVFRHPGGAAKHYLGYVLFLPLPNVVSFVAQGSCLIEYNRISNGMRLIDNAGTGWLGPLEGVPVNPSAQPLSNNACTVTLSGVSVALSGNDMTLTIPVTFKTAGVTPVLGTFIQENDVDGQWTDFRQFGNWTVPGASTKAGPYVTAAAPTNGSGSAVTLSVSAGHTGGASQIGQIHVRLNSAIVGGSPCHAVYFPGDNSVALVNDAGSGIVGPVPAGTPVNTGRCSIGAGVTRAISGNTITVNLPLAFTPSNFPGAKNVYVNVFDLSGAVSHWVTTGTWTVQ
jgi:parallel beta-helix repeat protein